MPYPVNVAAHLHASLLVDATACGGVHALASHVALQCTLRGRVGSWLHVRLSLRRRRQCPAKVQAEPRHGELRINQCNRECALRQLDSNQSRLLYRSPLYRARASCQAFIGPPPASIFELAALQFGRNLRAIFGSYDEIAGPLTPTVQANRAKLSQLKLSSAMILKREEARGGIPSDTPDIIRVPYVKLCEFIDVVFEER